MFGPTWIRWKRLSRPYIEEMKQAYPDDSDRSGKTRAHMESPTIGRSPKGIGKRKQEQGNSCCCKKNGRLHALRWKIRKGFLCYGSKKDRIGGYEKRYHIRIYPPFLAFWGLRWSAFTEIPPLRCFEAGGLHKFTLLWWSSITGWLDTANGCLVKRSQSFWHVKEKIRAMWWSLKHL